MNADINPTAPEIINKVASAISMTLARKNATLDTFPILLMIFFL